MRKRDGLVHKKILKNKDHIKKGKKQAAVKRVKKADIAETATIPVWKMNEKELRQHRRKTAGIFHFPQQQKSFNELERKHPLKKTKQKVKEKKKRPSIHISLHTKIVLIALAVILLSISIAFIYVLHTYTVKTIYVDGNSYYTDEEIAEMVMKGRWGHNSLYLNFKYHNQEVENIPFISALEVNIVTPDTVRITVYEKSLAGYVSYMGRYMYFDKDGTVVESSENKISSLPEVEGLSFDHVVMSEKLPVEDENVFSEILDITQALEKYSLEADMIYFDPDSEITLYFGDIRAEIGEGDNLDDKLSQIQVILPELDGMEGVLQLADYTADTKTVTFQSDVDLNLSDSVSGNEIESTAEN